MATNNDDDNKRREEERRRRQEESMRRRQQEERQQERHLRDEREKRERDRDRERTKERERRKERQAAKEREKRAEKQREERRRRNEEQAKKESGLPPGIAGAAAAAAGTTAGVSALYHTGKISTVAKQVDRFTHFLQDAKMLSERHLQDDPTITNYRAFLRDAKQAWKARGDEVSNGIRLSFRPGTLFEHIREMDALSNASGIGGRALNTGVIATNTRQYFARAYAQKNDFDYNTLTKFNRFIETISHHPSDTEHFIRTEQKFNFNMNDMPIVRDLERIMKEQAENKDLRKTVKKTAKAQAAAAAEQGLGIDMLKRRFGKGDPKKEGLIDRVNRVTQSLFYGNDRAATLEDVFNNEKRILDSWQYKNKGEKMEAKRTIDRLKELREEFKARGQEQDFLDLRPDSFGLRVDAYGQLYSFSSSHEIYDSLLGTAASTLPGKILKLRDFQYLGKMPAAHYFARGEKDPILAARIRRDGDIQDDGLLAEGRLDADYYQIGDRIYRGLSDGTVEDTGIEGMHMISGRFGAQYRSIRAMLGDTRYKKSDNRFLAWADIGQDYEEWNGGLFNGIKGIFQKKEDPTWRGNVFRNLFDNSDEARQNLWNTNPDTAMRYLNDVDTLMDFMQEHTFKLDANTVQKLIDQMPSDSEARKYLEILQESDVDKVEYKLFQRVGSSIGNHKGVFLNEDLNRLMNLRSVDPGDAQNVLDLQEKQGIPASDIFSAFRDNTINRGADYEEQLRRNIGLEALMRYAHDAGGDNGSDYKAVFDLLKNADLTQQGDINARRLASIAYLQNQIGVNLHNRISIDEHGNYTNIDGDLATEIGRLFEGFSGTTDESKEFRETTQNLINEHVSDLESYYHNDAIETPESYSEIMHINDSIGIMSILNSMNDYTKFKATTRGFFKQWNAGRDNPADVTTATLVPYFFLKRLSDDMNAFGLGFSRESVGNTGEFIKNIMMKRALPIMLAANYFEWADDTSQELTGTSITGAAANGIADVDLAFRKVLDTTGVRDWLNEEKSINPIMQYWGDHTDFMSYDERKKYYESGYDPVRKGAWWTFGGVNEARGGEITYWEPSFVRRINSDYEDKALYDGYFDKWSHSLLPTPTNPLSPLFAILDPYWLEKKHEDDRPYPVSGPMFQEGTPWGAILNSTIGELIKPETELHPWRMRNGVDLESVLHRANEWIKDKARDIGRQNYFVINGNSMTPVSFTAYNAPTEDTKMYSMQAGPGDGSAREEEGIYGVMQSGSEATAGLGDGNGSGTNPTGGAPTGGGIASAMTGLKDVDADSLLEDHSDEPIDYKAALKQKIFGVGEGYVQNGRIVTDKDGKLKEVVYKPKGEAPKKEWGDIKLEDSLELDAIINGDENGIKGTLRQIVKAFRPVDQIKKLNDDTKTAAAYNAAYDTSEGIMTPDKLTQYRPSEGMALLDDADTVAELVNQGQGYDLVHDAAVSWRLVAGIYGYMGGAAFGIGDQTQKQIARSSDMTSFGRSFWDTNMGGAGGDVMEIVRRFIPDFKRGTRVNPLMNEMPDWMPERFRYGDPYTKIVKGEMRLPGKGYESLNKLHPDAYGYYGSFDRFKILADVAPFSPEYKVWKQIAQKTVTDPELIQEMNDIKERVNEQGKKHDFYDYKVLGRGVNYQNVVVSEVLGHGQFRSGDQIYKIAGIKVQGNANETMTQVLSHYLKPGDEITIATDENQAEGQNRDAKKSINAAVFVNGGENLAQTMLANGDATKRKGDNSAAASLPNYSGTQKAIAMVSELIAHADVPWLSDQFLRVRTPLESYNAEQVYGTTYQSWDHPIDSFLMPAIERAIHERDWWNTPLSWGLDYLVKKEGMHGSARALVDATYALTNRGAFVGAAVSNLIAPGTGRTAMHVMSNLTAAAHVLTGGSGYLDETASAAFIGRTIAHKLEKSEKWGALLGGAWGLVYRGMSEDSNWVPQRTRDKWKMQEYFDHLTYTKYMGLYHAAAKKAKEEEGIDVEDEEEIRQLRDDSRRKVNDRIKKIKEDLRATQGDTPEKERLLKMLNEKLKDLQNSQTILKGGEWTHSALIYKQAADSTMTGLKKGSTWSQIITALPTNDREYFMEFVKESDPSKRQQILDSVSPQLRKALNLAWGKTKDSDLNPEKENAQYFRNHVLPKETWTGWRPDVDLKNVEVKEINNEGMLLSDFGFYESQMRDPQVINAPKIDKGDGNASIISRRLSHILQGQGLDNVNVSVTAAADGTGTQIMSNLKVYAGMKETKEKVDDAAKQSIA